MSEHKVVAAYLRVSTKKQEAEGHSILTQYKHAKEYALRNNLELLNENIFKDDKPASKKVLDKLTFDESIKQRPELFKLMSMVQQKKVSDIIVYARDRLARNTEEYRRLQFFFLKYGVNLHFSSSSENISVSDEKIYGLIDFIMISIAELEANLISTRVYQGNKRCVEKQLWPGGKMPYGYFPKKDIISPRNTTLQIDPHKSVHVKEIYRLYDEYGYGYTKIAEIMKVKYPSENWKKWTIETILKNKTYTGSIYWNRRGGRRNPGKRTEIISSKEIQNACIIDNKFWDRVEKLRNKKKEINDPKYFDTPYLLKRKLFCAKPAPCYYYACKEDRQTNKLSVCNRQLVTRDYGKNKKKVYKCPQFSYDDRYAISKIIIDKDLIEEVFIKEFKKLIDLKNIETFWTLFNQEQKRLLSEIQKAVEQLTQNINNFELKVEHINYVMETELVKHKDDAITKDILISLKELKLNFEKRISSKIEELEKLRARQQEFNISKENFNTNLKKIIDNFGNLKKYNKRIIIDTLIDKIYVSSHEDNINIDIVVSIPVETRKSY